MKFKINKNHISILLNIVFIVFALTFLVDSGLHRLCIYLATLLWIIEGNFKEKFNQLYEQKIILIYLLIICCFLFSLTFLSSSIENGFWYAKYSNGYVYLVDKPIQYFLMAIFISTSLKKEFLKWILVAFLLQTMYMMYYIIYIYFCVLDGKIGFIVLNMHRNNYAVTLLLGLSVLFYFLSIYKNKFFKLISFVLVLLFYFAILISTSRIGIVILFFINFYLFFFYFKKFNNLRTFIMFLASFIILVFLSVNLNSRINLGINNFKKTFSENNYNSSVGIRIAQNIVSIELLTKNIENFIFGLGMGNTKKIFEEHVNKTDLNKKNILLQPHVHNQYFQTWIDGGVTAFILYLIFLYFLFSIKVEKSQKLFKIIVLIIFIVLGFSTIFYNNVRYIALLAYSLGVILSFNRFLNLK